MIKQAALNKIVTNVVRSADEGARPVMNILDAVVNSLFGGKPKKNWAPKATGVKGTMVHPPPNKQINITKPRTIDDVRETLRLATEAKRNASN